MAQPSMAAPAALHETHSAVVFFVGDHAYKLKKPVDLGFLDFRTREARVAVCHREVELNRRLAPDVYEGVADILGPDGEVCDHLVVMRRMPDDRRLSTLVQAGADVVSPLREVAKQLASLHDRSSRSVAADFAAGSEATRARWTANTDQMIEDLPGAFDEAALGLVHGLACRYLDGRPRLLEHRIAAGRAVDGHGDLLADDIFLLDDGPRILDCLEFDDGLRLGDGLADAAFLAMDLDRLGRPDLRDLFLHAYGEARRDGWPASLAHHQIAYRAQVRAKVTAIRAEQGDHRALVEARGLLELSLAHLRRGRVRLVLIGGLPGTGKSTLAAALGEQLGFTVLRSDVVRKELAGVAAGGHRPSRFREGIYDDRGTMQTYDELLDRALLALEMGESVILDASWTDPLWREAADRAAWKASADLVQIRCVAPQDVASRRIASRNAAGLDASDATVGVAAAMEAAMVAWPDALVVDTTGSVVEEVEAAIRLGHLDT